MQLCSAIPFRSRIRPALLVAAGMAALLLAGPSATAAPAPASNPAVLPAGRAASAGLASAGLGTGPEAITWTIDPASSEGPDGRAWAELTLDPGRSVTEHLAVRNLSKTPVTFAITAADGYFTDTGRFNMLLSSQPSTAAGTWISVADSVDVPPGGTVVLPYTVAVPENATPGDHAAGIAASVRMVGENPDGGGTLGVESRVGFRVMTRVTGQVQPSLTAGDLATEYRTSWNPLTPGSLDVHAVVANSGNVALAVTGVVTAGGGQATLSIPNGSSTIELLPGDRREVSATVPGVWPLGPVGATAQFTAAATGLDPISVSTGTTIWAMPWPQLAALALLVLLALAFLADRRRRRHRLHRLLEAERAAGRAEATNSATAGSAG